MRRIIVDADGCPVKEEVYRVAGRHGWIVLLVADAPLRVPELDWIGLEVVPRGYNAADDRIAEHAEPGDVIVTADIPLAARCLDKGARAVTPSGRIFTPDTIGGALASRALMSHLRESGEFTGGPAPRADRDRSRFLQSLERLIQEIKREHP